MVAWTQKGSEVLVNTTTTGNQSGGSVAALADGRYVVTWTDNSATGGDTSGNAIRGQLFNTDGTKSGTEFLVNTTTTGDQVQSSVAALAGGGFVITWRSPDGIRGQVFNPDGSALGAEFLTDTPAGMSAATFPSTTAMPDGSFVVTWYAGYSYGQAFTASGAAAGPAFRFDGIGSGFFTSVAALANGDLIVIWQDQRAFVGAPSVPSSHYDLFGRVFHADGTSVGAQFSVDTDLSASDETRVAALTDGRFVVTWTDSFGDGHAFGTGISGVDPNNFGIRGQVFNSDGTKFGSEFLVNTTTDGVQTDSYITALPNGLFVVTWADSYVGSPNSRPYGVRAQVFDADGTKIGGEFLAYSGNPVNPDPSVAALANGDLAFTWTDSGHGDTSGTGTYTTIFSAGSEVFPGNRDQYFFTENNNYNYTVTGPQGTQTLANVQQFIFNDVTVEDDAIGGLGTTATISVNGSATGNIQFYGDRDWFKTSLQGGHYYEITLSGGRPLDQFLRVYNSDGTLVASNHRVGDGDTSLLYVQVNGSGDFYLGAGALNDASLGAYGLHVEDFGVERFDVGQFRSLNGAFTASAGWTSNDQYPRMLADVNGDGLADIVGFASNGTWVSLATGDGSFAQPSLRFPSGFSFNSGWSSEDQYPRTLADVNGDGMADIVGFGTSGVYVSLATGNGNFGSATVGLSGAFTTDAGWTSNGQYPRALADVNGDGMADIVGFASNGVWVSLATGGGSFAAPSLRFPSGFSADSGWTSNDEYPRMLADVNGDGMADVVGFGSSAVYVSLATGNGNFASATVGLSGAFTGDAGWTSNDKYPRVLADVNGDGMADIVGFASNGTWLSFATGGGHFGSPIFMSTALSTDSSWTSNDEFPRVAGDVDGDGAADIVGFGSTQVWEGQFSAPYTYPFWVTTPISPSSSASVNAATAASESSAIPDTALLNSYMSSSLLGDNSSVATSLPVQPQDAMLPTLLTQPLQV